MADPSFPADAAIIDLEHARGTPWPSERRRRKLEPEQKYLAAREAVARAVYQSLFEQRP
ncbi:hypothetical protein [Sorangium sp. So ce854]|uniref:hypothetical protein n=1 Tax=Sorangium sp. So ce854 TaxID=3133322 RepID=UPI003F5E1642